MENINRFGGSDTDSGINEPQSYPSADGIEVEEMDVEDISLSSEAKDGEDSSERVSE